MADSCASGMPAIETIVGGLTRACGYSEVAKSSAVKSVDVEWRTDETPFRQLPTA